MNRNNFKPGSKPAVHNQKKQFNPNKYGKLWGSIRTELSRGTKAMKPQGESNQPIICKLFIGGKEFELTHSETNRLIEELYESQSTYKKALRLGMLDANVATGGSYM